MSFIFIDHGSTVNRPYRTVTDRPISPISKTAASAKVHSKDIHQPIDALSDHSQQGYAQHADPISEYQQNTSQQTERKKVSEARDIMVSPVIVLEHKHHTAIEAWSLMQEHHIRHLPVVKKGKLMGMVCERDLLLSSMANRSLPDFLEPIMVHQVHAASPDTDIHQLAHVMFDEHIGSLPIIDQKQTVIGIVTRFDILKVMSHYGPMEYWA